MRTRRGRGFGAQGQVGLPDGGGDLLPRVALEQPLVALPRHPAGKLGIVEEPLNLLRQLGGVAVLERETALPDDAGHRPAGRDDHRRAAGPCLQDHDAECLEAGREHQDVGEVQEVNLVRVRNGAEIDDPRPVLGGKASIELVEPGRRRAREQERGVQVAREALERLDESGDALVFELSSQEQDGPGVLGPAVRLSQLGLEAGGVGGTVFVHMESGAGGHDLRGIDALAGEVVSFVLADDDDRVRALQQPVVAPPLVVRVPRVKVRRDDDRLSAQPCRQIPEEVVRIGDGVEVDEVRVPHLPEQAPVHLDRVGPIEIDSEPPVQHDLQQGMVEAVDGQGSPVSPHKDPVVPGQPSKPDGALVDRRISPELLLLDHVEGQDLHLVARRGQVLAELPAPRLGAADGGGIPLDDVQDFHGVSS